MALVAFGCGSMLVARRAAGAFGSPRPFDDGTGWMGVVGPIGTSLVGVLLVLLVDLLTPASESTLSSARHCRQSAAAGWIARLGLAFAMAAVLPAPAALLGGQRPAPIGLFFVAAAVAVAVATLLAPLTRRPSVARRTRLDQPRGRPRDLPSAKRPVAEAAPADRQRGLPSPSESLEQRLATHTPPAPLPEASAPHDGPFPISARGEIDLPPVPSGASVQQRFERFVIVDDGMECVRGTIHLSVVAGTRSATGHVGFCPPFHAVPQVEVGTRSEVVEAAIVAAEILPWGVRVECRLDDTADETIDIPVDIVARAPLGSTDAPLPSPSRH